MASSSNGYQSGFVDEYSLDRYIGAIYRSTQYAVRDGRLSITGGGSLPAVSFRPEALRGAPPGVPVAGEITYRLARNAVGDQVRKGRLSRHDVCDAHTELFPSA